MPARNSNKQTTRTNASKPTSGTPAEEKTARLMEYVEVLAALNDSDEETSAAPSHDAEQDLAAMTSVVEAKLDRFLAAMDEKLDKFLQNIRSSQSVSRSHWSAPGTPNATSAETLTDDLKEASEEVESGDSDVSEMLSDWDRRKIQMLAELGEPQAEIVPTQKSKTETKPVIEVAVVQEEIDDREPPRLGDAEEDQELDALHDSIASLNSFDAEQIDDLKQQLTLKLRDAEVELSINRAKLSQQWAALELKQHEVARREMSLKSKYGGMTPATKKTGILGRFSRHLSSDKNRNDDAR